MRSQDFPFPAEIPTGSGRGDDGRHAEAEWYCRTANDLGPSRSNGFKNLDQPRGPGRYEPAIEAWITATRVYPEDPRSLGHLERLRVCPFVRRVCV